MVLARAELIKFEFWMNISGLSLIGSVHRISSWNEPASAVCIPTSARCQRPCGSAVPPHSIDRVSIGDKVQPKGNCGQPLRNGWQPVGIGGQLISSDDHGRKRATHASWWAAHGLCWARNEMLLKGLGGRGAAVHGRE